LKTSVIERVRESPSPDAGSIAPPSVGVIVPTLNEATRLPGLLTALACEEPPHTVVVVDGGSADGTVALARAAGARVLVVGGGRGVQLRAAARLTDAPVLLFLHADCVFPAGGLGRVLEALAGDPALVGGNFRVVFDGGDRFSRGLGRIYDWNRRIRRRYYGDSGIFVRREAYGATGGIRPIALMEDLDFVRRLERHGRTVQIREPPLVTSSRRFRRRSAIAIVAGWLLLHVLFALGVSPDRLARLYDSQRRRLRH
jgi:rSAM/selenodomain-associated transferase 2